LAELPTSYAATQRLLEQSAAQLRTRARELRGAHNHLTSEIEDLRWRGYGATRFRRLIRKELVQLDHCATRIGRAAHLLDGLADDAKQAASSLAKKEDEVRAAIAAWPGGEAAFLAEYNRTALPPEGDRAWASIWKQVFGENQTGGARAPD
jgi:uncharacterized protein YukE